MTANQTPRPEDEKAFRDQLPSLLVNHLGKFALIHDAKLVDVFDTMLAAYSEGVKRFQLDPIFIGHIVEHDEPQSAPALQHGLIHACP